MLEGVCRGYAGSLYCLPVGGNRALVFLVNRGDEAGYGPFYLGLLPALNHFGIPFRILDVARDAVSRSLESESAGIILATMVSVDRLLQSSSR